MNRFNELGNNAIQLRDSQVLSVSSSRCLEVILDAKLSWHEHIIYISKKANRLKYHLLLLEQYLHSLL